MLNFSVGLALFFVLIRLTGKQFTVKGLVGIILFGMACYGLGWVVVELVRGLSNGCP